jgi:beta-lactamase regulating signal transducer with metallopeptidase domain
MSVSSDLILLIVNLAANLLLFGFFIAGGVAVSFRLIKNAHPRLRYVVTVTAFLLAACLPLTATLNGSIGLTSFIEAKQTGNWNDIANDNYAVQTSVGASEIISFEPAPEPEKTSYSLNNLTRFVADSFVGYFLFVLWIAGSACLLLRDVFAHRQITKARRAWRSATKRERKELAFPEGERLYFGEESPATIGFFYPAIVLPNRFPDNLSLAAKRSIIQHELAHARWRDPLVNAFLRAVRALFWISPAFWVLEKTAEIEREAAADFAAVAKSSADKTDFEMDALDYATALVSVAKHFNSFSRRGFSSPEIGLNSGDILEDRVRRLLSCSSRPTVFRISLASIIFAISLTGLLFIPIAFQPEEMKSHTSAAIINNQESVELNSDENLSELSAKRKENEPPQFIKNSENKGNTKTILSISKREQPSTAARGNFHFPQIIAVTRRKLENLPNDTVDTTEELQKKLSEEDAKANGIEKEMDEISGEIQGLDAARKNPGSSIPQVRQKAASQIDLLMRQQQSPDDSKRKSN